MKWFLYLLSVYFVALSVLPCHDGVECSDAKTEVSQKHNHSEETEQCPPFCACACCGIHVVQMLAQVDFPTKKTIFFSNKEHFNYAFVGTEAALFSIWQPPKWS